MNVLGIETSCDETAAAIVRDGWQVLSNVVFSQAKLHEPYGGVVPEIASRSHVESLPGVISEAVSSAGIKWCEIDMIAATFGPGLASSLLVGVAAAKGLSLRLRRPLRAVNHLEAHIFSVFLGHERPSMDEVSPFLALVVSGGHTCLVEVEGLGKYRLKGQTVDDAAGEAFDKGASLLGLGYPGGPRVQKAAAGGLRDFVRFPRSRPRKTSSFLQGLNPEMCLSFSGLKTALLYYLRDNPLSPENLPSIAASYQEAIVDNLIESVDRALGANRGIAAGGGVSLNGRLRERLLELGCEKHVDVRLAEPSYCGDNAAMIAALAGAKGYNNADASTLDLDVVPSLSIDNGSWD